MGKPLTSSRAIPFQGGIDEVHEKPHIKPIGLLDGRIPVGMLQAQNVRPLRPEFEQRGGMSKQHTTTAHSTKEIISMFGFSKGRIDEKALFAQLDNGSVEKATTNPPGTTTGNFGSSVLAARSNPAPGTFASFKDFLLYADGAGRAQIYTGQDAPIYAFNVYKGVDKVVAIKTNYEENDAEVNISGVGGATEKQAQEFQVSETTDCTKVEVYIRKNNSPTDNIVARIETDSSGLPSGTLVDVSATASLAGSGLSATLAWTTFTFASSFQLVSGTVYHLVLERDGARDTTNNYKLGVDSTSPTYPDGEREVQTSGSWADISASDCNFRVYGENFVIPNVPEEGADYTQEVTDGLTTTYADAGSLDALSDGQCLFVITEVPINKLNFAFSAWNSTEVGNLAVKYWNGTNLTAVSGLSDGTQGDGSGGSGTIEFGKDGALTWTSPSDEVPFYAFGRSGFIYQISHSHATNTFDSSVHITSITCEYTGGFQDLQNVWDGILIDAIEARVYDAGSDTYSTYSSQSIKPGGLTTSGYIYVNSNDPLFGIYLDVAKTPNTTADTTIDEVATWTGAGWTVLTNVNDGTNGGSNSGYVTWSRNTSIRKVNFNSSRYNSYWYRIKFDQTLSGSLTWAVQTLPYFNIDEIYPVVQSLAAWDRRVWFCFNDNILYGTAQLNPTGLNGDDFAILEIGDNRSNKILCMRKFYNFMLVWQEEKGSEGGGFHLIEPGSTAAGYDSQIISPTIGILNSKCAVVLEGVTMGDLNTERPIMTGAYFVSRTGAWKSDGSFLKNISGGIANYFDPEKSECIREGYADKHFLGLDSTNGVLLLGIVSGASATEPNKFFVLDPTTDEWTEDIWGYNISCTVEVGAASGNIPLVQLAGCQDGFVRRINDGNLDDDQVITSNIILGVDGRGRRLVWTDEVFRCKTQSSGNIIRSVALNSNSNYKYPKTFPMVAKDTGDSYRRFRERPGDNMRGDYIAIKYENSTSDVPARYVDFGFELDEIDAD